MRRKKTRALNAKEVIEDLIGGVCLGDLLKVLSVFDDDHVFTPGNKKPADHGRKCRLSG